MEPTPAPPPEPGPGEPDVIASPARPARRRRRRVLAGAAALLLVAAAGGAGIAVAADGSPSPSTPAPSGSTADPSTGTRSSDAMKGRGLPGRPGMPRGLHALRGPWGALHGEFVVPDGNGGYRTMLVQRGQVTAVSSSSITVRSDDGYSRTYAVTADTIVNARRDGISSIRTGSSVRLVAVQAGNTATATAVVDVGALRAARDRWGPDRDAPRAPDGSTPSPSTTGSARTSSFGISAA